jgi:hypothetical protein
VDSIAAADINSDANAFAKSSSICIRLLTEKEIKILDAWIAHIQYKQGDSENGIFHIIHHLLNFITEPTSGYEVEQNKTEAIAPCSYPVEKIGAVGA